MREGGRGGRGGEGRGRERTLLSLVGNISFRW